VPASATGLAAPPCAAGGAGVADLAWRNPDVVKPEEPIAAPVDGDNVSADANVTTKTAMRF